MSLFDDDLSASSSSSCSNSLHEQGSSDAPVSFFPSGGSRFTLTTQDAQRAEDRRRKELSGGYLDRASKGEAGNATEAGGSRFHASIAEALHKRREAREEVLLRRIKKQREEEANDAEFVEKDREVGVFVTPQYLAAQKRHAKASESDPPPRERHGAKPLGPSGGGDDVAEDPLEAYVRGLEAQRGDAVPAPPAAPDAAAECEAPVERSTALHPAPHGVAVPQQAPPSLSVPVPSETENAAERSEDVLREARNARKRVRVDRAFVEAAAVRFNARSWQCVLQQ